MIPELGSQSVRPIYLEIRIIPQVKGEVSFVDNNVCDKKKQVWYNSHYLYTSLPMLYIHIYIHIFFSHLEIRIWLSLLILL